MAHVAENTAGNTDSGTTGGTAVRRNDDHKHNQNFNLYFTFLDTNTHKCLCLKKSYLIDLRDKIAVVWVFFKLPGVNLTIQGLSDPNLFNMSTLS